MGARKRETQIVGKMVAPGALELVSQEAEDQSELQVDRGSRQPTSGSAIFEYLETATYSVSVHVPGEQSVFLCLFGEHRRPSRDIYVTRSFTKLPSHAVDEVTNPQASATAALQAAAAPGSMSAVTPGKPCSAWRESLREEIHPNMASTHSIPRTRFARMLPEVKLPPPMEVSSHGGSLGDLQRSVVGRPISKLRSKTSSFRCQLTLLRHRSLLQVGSIQI